MKDTVTRRHIHARMALASWMLPLGALFVFSIAGEHTLFARNVPASLMNRQLGYDIVAISMLVLGAGFSVWCLTRGSKDVPGRYYWHPWFGLLATAAVLGILLLMLLLWHPTAAPA